MKIWKTIVYGHLIILSFVKFAHCENVINFSFGQFLDNHHLAININLTNTDSIAGMQLPIVFNRISEGFAIDTVIFTGGRAELFEFKHYEILDNQSGLFLHLVSNINYQSENKSLPPGSGTLCKIIFSWPDSIRIANQDSLSSRNFKLDKARILRDNNELSGRDFGFAIWKPDASAISGRVEALLFPRR